MAIPSAIAFDPSEEKKEDKKSSSDNINDKHLTTSRSAVSEYRRKKAEAIAYYRRRNELSRSEHGTKATRRHRDTSQKEEAEEAILGANSTSSTHTTKAKTITSNNLKESKERVKALDKKLSSKDQQQATNCSTGRMRRIRSTENNNVLPRNSGRSGMRRVASSDSRNALRRPLTRSIDSQKKNNETWEDVTTAGDTLSCSSSSSTDKEKSQESLNCPRLRRTRSDRLNRDCSATKDRSRTPPPIMRGRRPRNNVAELRKEKNDEAASSKYQPRIRRARSSELPATTTRVNQRFNGQKDEEESSHHNVSFPDKRSVGPPYSQQQTTAIHVTTSTKSELQPSKKMSSSLISHIKKTLSSYSGHELINKERVKNGLKPFNRNEMMDSIAESQARSMAKIHGREPIKSIYIGHLLRGTSVQAIHNGIMKNLDSVERATILSNEYQQFGYGCAKNDKDGLVYVCQLFSPEFGISCINAS